jgi:hypothetical protein
MREPYGYFMIQRIRTDETSCRSSLTIRFPRDKHLIPPATNPRPVSLMGIVGARRPEFSKLNPPIFSCNSLTPPVTTYGERTTGRLLSDQTLALRHNLRPPRRNIFAFMTMLILEI